MHKTMQVIMDQAAVTYNIPAEFEKYIEKLKAYRIAAPLGHKRRKVNKIWPERINGKMQAEHQDEDLDFID